jgi:hypothetical protein
LPNFLTLENTGQVSPLTTGQKFKEVTRGSFDYAEYPWYAFLAGIGQAENGEPAFGQGAAGYAKRYGSEFADGTIENYFTSAIFPAGKGRVLAPRRLRHHSDGYHSLRFREQ